MNILDILDIERIDRIDCLTKMKTPLENNDFSRTNSEQRYGKVIRNDESTTATLSIYDQTIDQRDLLYNDIRWKFDDPFEKWT